MPAHTFAYFVGVKKANPSHLLNIEFWNMVHVSKEPLVDANM